MPEHAQDALNHESWLAEQFEQNRGHLRGVAYRMLGSATEAEDAVQETWLRLSRSDAASIDNLGGWLTTVVARVCLDMLRSRKARREEALDPQSPPVEAGDANRPPRPNWANQERELLLADSVGVAMLLVLNTLAPPERVAFVLHDMFGISFDEIAPIVNRTPTAARQLASRARRRVQGKPTVPEADLNRQRAVVDAFLAAARGGNFEALLTMLDPDVEFHGDHTAAALGGHAEFRGAHTIASFFNGRAAAARTALIDGTLGVVVAPGNQLLVVLRFTVVDDKITAIDAIADREAMDRMQIAPLQG
jgi:RNA polymerase sigma-70 factor, ECF subfamily